MKTPGPEHPITVTANRGRVTVSFNGQRIAASDQAMVLAEADYPAVLYIPREDVDMSALERTAHATHCPFKGDAAYYTLRAGGRVAENAVWSYESPYPAVAAIADHLAFYPSHVSIEQT